MVPRFLAGLLVLSGCWGTTNARTLQAASVLAPPPAGKLYQGLFSSSPDPATDDETEHNVTAADVLCFEQAVGKKNELGLFFRQLV